MTSAAAPVEAGRTGTRDVSGDQVDASRRDVVRFLTTRPALRATGSPLEARAADAPPDAQAGDGTLMYGHFAVFDTWTEIDSWFEGRFLESFAPGSFKRTMKDNRDGMRVLTEHGRDPQLGNRALGPIDELREDPTGADTGKAGAYYEVPLLDAPDVRGLVLPRLRAKLYGASFRFQVVREEINDDPGASDENPLGLQTRVVKEARVFEFGPVTFPAYADASADVRCLSLTDDVVAPARSRADAETLLARMATDPELRTLVLARADEWRDAPAATAPTATAPAPSRGRSTPPRLAPIARRSSADSRFPEIPRPR